MIKKHIMPVWALLFLLFSCGKKETADVILLNGQFYSVDTAFSEVEAIAIKNGLIWNVGSRTEMEALSGEQTKVLDLKGNFVMPGFIEGHGHFSGVGKSLMQLNFLQSRSWEDIVAQVKAAATSAAPGTWIEGRGWHQEKWDSVATNNVQGYPLHDALSAVSPNNPVVLRHASGHALFANKKAMQVAGINLETPAPPGGAIIRDGGGQAIGVFEERAMNLILESYQAYLDSLSKDALLERWHKGISLAQQEALEQGVTSFQDAGTTPGADFLSSYEELAEYEKLARHGKLRLRIWAMLRQGSEDLKTMLNEFPKLNVGKGFFTCRAIKSELDGALGARGAWLLEDYQDKPGFKGQNTTPVSEVETIGMLALEHGMQLCVHAIGDRGNHETLDVFEKLFKAHPDKTGLRWRIEHAQHLSPSDIPRFKDLGVVAAMQGVHCTSDAPFVVQRLGEERAREGAYAWQALLKAGAVVGNGTDAPVEPISPIENFYASVTRKRHQSTHRGESFFAEQAMTRAQAIHSYTMANAYAAFEEDIKGSLTPGKYADLVVLSKNLLTCSDEEILETEVLLTMVGGKVEFQNEGF